MSKSSLSTIRASAATTSSWVATSAIKINYWAWMDLRVLMTATATSDQVLVIPEVSFNATDVAESAYEWWPCGLATSTLTSQSIGTAPSGALYGNFNFYYPELRNAVIATGVASNSGDKIVAPAQIFIGGARAFRLQVKAAAGTPTCSVIGMGFGKF